MKNYKLVVGIDEAGRGPIIGPMIIAGVALKREDLERLREKGVKDSKSLTPAERKKLYHAIHSVAEHIVVVRIEPQLIDTLNLNTIEYAATAFIVGRILLRWKSRIETIYIDLVGSKKKLLGVLKKEVSLGESTTVIVEEKADEKYVAVSAASILAKVLRDSIVEDYKKIYGEIGSGYPHDPLTLNWIKRAYRGGGDPPPILRRTWSTLKRIAPKWYKPKKVLREAKKNKSILEYLNPSP